MPGKRCAWGLCRSDSRYDHKDYMKGVIFLPFPKPKTQLERCKEWIRLCNRPHSQLNVEKIGKHHYVCSKHFKEGCVDPESAAVQIIQAMKRKPSLDRHMHTLKVARQHMQGDNPLNTKATLEISQPHTSQTKASQPHTRQTEEDPSFFTQSSSPLTTEASITVTEQTSQSAQASPPRPTKRPEITCTAPRTSSLWESWSVTSKNQVQIITAKETDESENEKWTMEKQGTVGESFSKSTCNVACLVCNRPFKTTNNSVIPNLPFCKGCKNIYFTLVGNRSLSPLQTACPKGGQCVIDYKTLGPKEWCTPCHVWKFKAILRRFDALQVNTGCNQNVEKPRPSLRSRENLDMNPVVLIEKLTNEYLASLGIGIPEASRSGTTVTEKNENRFLPPPKISTDRILPHQPPPLSNHLKKRKKIARLKKASKVKNPFMKSIDIYVFDCGHACSVCNSAQAKKWLKDCGFYTTSPSTADAINPTINHCTNSLSPPAQDNLLASGQEGVALSGQQSDRTQPENSRELHTHCSVGHGSAVSQNSQETGPSAKFFIPVTLRASFFPPTQIQTPDDSVSYGNIPTVVLPPEGASASTPRIPSIS